MKGIERSEASRKSFALTVLGMTVFLAFAVSGAGAVLLQTGDAFPAWELTDQTGKRVTSEELSGKTYVLWFYPKAMTPGCTAEGRGFRDKSEAYAEQGVVIFGVSFDKPEENAKFVEQEGFPFRLLSDGDHKLASSVGAVGTFSFGFARRISYVVGPDGRVLHVYEDVDPKSHAGNILSDLGGQGEASQP
jgi:peroxiredoxin Q/BCP